MVQWLSLLIAMIALMDERDHRKWQRNREQAQLELK